jgi:hypothetical protein
LTPWLDPTSHLAFAFGAVTAIAGAAMVTGRFVVSCSAAAPVWLTRITPSVVSVAGIAPV